MPNKRDMGNEAFWSVDDLTPPEGKKKNRLPKAFAPKDEVRFAQPSQKKETIQKPSFPCATSVHARRGSLMKEYTQKGMLVEQVRISSWPTPYSFFELFKRDALRFFDTCLGEEEFEPFFSFMPQYFQLSGKQLRYYLWWRENLRNGKLLRTDYSYVLLYIYEILNLPEKIEPKLGAKQMALLWARCRGDYPRLDRYLSEWMADYCLIHQIPLPVDLLLPFYADILQKTTVKEYYIDALDTEKEGGRTAYYRAVMEMSTTYRFRDSKAITPDNRKLFETHFNISFFL